MTDDVKPVIVSANAGPIDGLQSIGRIATVILSTAPAAILLLRKHDLIGLYDYFQTNQGVALAGALSGLIAAGYGVYKSFKRGAQIATVASDPNVPNSVAVTKQEISQ